MAERNEAQRLPRNLFFPPPHPQPFSSFFNKREKGENTSSDYASLIEPTWLAIFAVNRIGMVGDHIPGAALSPLPLGEGQGEGIIQVLDGQLQPVAFRVEEGALVIAVAGPAGAVQVFDLGALEQLEARRHLVHRLHAAEGKGEMGQPLQRVRQVQIRRKQDGGVHQLQAGAPFETHEVRAALLARIVVALIGLPAKQGAVECLECLQILRPDGDVMDMHGWSPVT